MSNFLQHPRSPHGEATFGTEEGLIQVQTLQCPHCGEHWKWETGSGRKHKYCGNCHGTTCSKKVCIENCIPLEKYLDTFEKTGVDLFEVASGGKPNIGIGIIDPRTVLHQSKKTIIISKG